MTVDLSMFSHSAALLLLRQSAASLPPACCQVTQTPTCGRQRVLANSTSCRTVVAEDPPVDAVVAVGFQEGDVGLADADVVGRRVVVQLLVPLLHPGAVLLLDVVAVHDVQDLVPHLRASALRMLGQPPRNQPQMSLQLGCDCTPVTECNTVWYELTLHGPFCTDSGHMIGEHLSSIGDGCRLMVVVSRFGLRSAGCTTHRLRVPAAADRAEH